MTLNNSDTLRLLNQDAGWRPGDDPAPVYRRFAARMRDIAADEAAHPTVRRRAHEDIVSISRLTPA